jgi:hypothetical protein
MIRRRTNLSFRRHGDSGAGFVFYARRNMALPSTPRANPLFHQARPTAAFWTRCNSGRRQTAFPPAAGRTARMIFTVQRQDAGHAATAPILIGDIVINELMYDPISGNDDDQYIELYNKGTNTVNLAGWQFTSGVTFTFPSVTIAHERLSGRGAQPDQFVRQVSQPEQREHGGQLQRQAVAQWRVWWRCPCRRRSTPTRNHSLTWRSIR